MRKLFLIKSLKHNLILKYVLFRKHAEVAAMTVSQTENDAKPWSRMSRRWITMLAIMLGINGLTVALAFGDRALAGHRSEGAVGTGESFASADDQSEQADIGSSEMTEVAETSAAPTT